MSSPEAPGTADRVTPPDAGAIAIIEVCGDVTRAFAALGAGAPPPPGDLTLRCCADVDDALLARTHDAHLLIMPHGGPFIVERIISVLRDAGFAARTEHADHGSDDRHAPFEPLATDDFTAMRLRLLARAASPLGVELLLNQPELLVEAARRGRPTPDPLLHLIDPPLVVLAGAANIGKSTLANALAGRRVAITFDAPGTTRDSISVRLDLAGLVVNWLDTPGLRESADPVEAAAIALARDQMLEADLLIAAADARSPWPVLPRKADLTVALAADRGARSDAQIHTSALARTGLEELARRCRDLLVPPELLEGA